MLATLWSSQPGMCIPPSPRGGGRNTGWLARVRLNPPVWLVYQTQPVHLQLAVGSPRSLDRTYLELLLPMIK